MKIFHGLNNLPRFKDPVIALGVFDGLHRGHSRILKSAVKKARQIHGTSIVVTFNPHPQGKESIYSLPHRLRLICGFGIDVCIVINFSAHFRRISALNFIKDILVQKFGCRYLYVGENFRFGKGAQGDLKLLKRLMKVYDFQLNAFDVVRFGGASVSSTYIRSLIRKGDLSLAKKLLTRPVSILGTVVGGDLLGRKLGFPTANIDPHHEVVPASGIYAVTVLLGTRKWHGACYIGGRPTLPGAGNRRRIEVHILDFKKDIYHKELEIHFLKKIRNDKKFASTSKLIEQIEKDLTAARKIASLHA
jgi:riboflavin kinase / FMN adenylyltransferase